MRRENFLFLSLIVLCLSGYSHSQLWSNILNPARAIDWSASGVPGGIPNRSNICSSIQASTYGNGTSDSTRGIQAALNGCPGNGVVMLSSGTFLLDSSLSIPSNVSLRGAGADQTILSLMATSGPAIVMGTGDPPGAVANSVSITSGSTAGSTSIVVSSAANFTVGGYIHITELNDPSYVTDVGSGGACTWCDGYWNGTRVLGQIVEVTSISGTTIGFTPALYTTYSLTPQALPFPASAKYAGLEYLQLYANNTGYIYNIEMSRCAYCWVMGVEGNYVSGNGDHIWDQWGYRDEIRDSYFSSAYSHTSGSTNNEIQLVFKTSGTLIENNIIERTQTAIIIGTGSAGNVIGYNYITSSLSQDDQALLVGPIYFHQAHAQFNLVEGNVVPQIWPDDVWGSSSTGTMYRNWIIGTALACTPLTGRSVVNCSGSNGVWATDAARAVAVDALETSYNFVGNVVGSAQQSGLPITKVASVQWPASRGYNVAYGFSWGYSSTGDSGNNPLDSTNPYATSFLHGNYNNIDGSLVWASGVTHKLPASFYRAVQPAWWGNAMWPAIGPDVTGGSGPGGYASAIPAQNCFTAIGGVNGGTGSPLTFNANKCYYSGSPGSPAPPSNLVAVPQ